MKKISYTNYSQAFFNLLVSLGFELFPNTFGQEDTSEMFIIINSVHNNFWLTDAQGLERSKGMALTIHGTEPEELDIAQIYGVLPIAA